ncbi:MAG: hypothetical protein ACR2H4_07505 [Pyrinomonadaceae bacterium]
MATVDAQVSIGDAGSGASSPSNPSMYRWPDSEVPRTAERLQDVTGVAIAATAYLVEGSMNGRTPGDTGEIITGIMRRNLIPIEWLTNQVGVLRTKHATVHLRYSPRNLTVELVSVPNERADGPAILIRVPDSDNTSVGTRYFESLQLDGIVYPDPFAPIPDIIASGWQPRLFKQTQLADADRAQLEHWAKATTRK